MRTTPDQKLLEWVRKFRADLTPDGTITRIELYHTVEGEAAERLATFEMADRDDDEDPDDLAQEIWDEAEEDSATRPSGTFQRYVVQAYRGDTREPDEMKSFTTRGKLQTGLLGSGSEPATPRGELAMQMRHTGDLHALVVRMCEATAGSAALQLQREREENQRLRETAFEYEKLRQQLLDRSLERDLKRKEEESNAELMKMLVATALQFAPVLLTRLMAPPPPNGASMPLAPAAPPQTAAPAATASPPSTAPVVLERDRLVAGLLGTFTPEQVGGLLSTFSDEQKQAFLAIYTSFREHPPTPPAASPPGDRHVN